MATSGQKFTRFGQVLSCREFDLIYCLDRGHLRYFAVSVTSFMKRLKVKPRRVFLVSPDIQGKEIGRFARHLSKRYSTEVALIRADYGVIDDLRGKSPWSLSSYARLLISDFVPESVTYCLFVDTDTIAVRDFSAQLEEAFSSLDSNSSHMMMPAPDDASHWASHMPGPYFNVGVLVLDLSRWRDQAASADLLHVARNQPEWFRFHDQDVLNHLWSERIGILPQSMNLKASEYATKKVDADVLHYLGSVKPWSDIYRQFPKPAMWRYEEARRATKFLRPTKRKTLPYLRRMVLDIWKRFS